MLAKSNSRWYIRLALNIKVQPQLINCLLRHLYCLYNSYYAFINFNIKPNSTNNLSRRRRPIIMMIVVVKLKSYSLRKILVRCDAIFSAWRIFTADATTSMPS
jgi:hypothetical protein